MFQRVFDTTYWYGSETRNPVGSYNFAINPEMGIVYQALLVFACLAIASSVRINNITEVGDADAGRSVSAV